MQSITDQSWASLKGILLQHNEDMVRAFFHFIEANSDMSYATLVDLWNLFKEPQPEEVHVETIKEDTLLDEDEEDVPIEEDVLVEEDDLLDDVEDDD